MYSFPNLESVSYSMSGSNCCFLTYIQVSQVAGKVVWYSHLFQNFPQFVVILTVKSFGVVNRRKYMLFWNSLAFSMIQQMLAIWSLVPLPFLNPAWTSEISWLQSPSTKQSVVPCMVLLLLDLHTDFSRGSSGGLVFPFLEEFSTICCDPQSQRIWHSQ